MVEKAKELRKIMPIPLGEALQLLKENEGNAEKCITLFKTDSIRKICRQTGCEPTMAEEYYEKEKYDFNRTVSSITEVLYDKNYLPIDGLTKEDLRLVVQWLYLLDAESFDTSLNFDHLNTVIKTMFLIPVLEDTAIMLTRAKKDKDIAFEGYKDSDSLREFVRRSRRLDESQYFTETEAIIILKKTIIKDELLRHLRNLQ